MSGQTERRPGVLQRLCGIPLHGATVRSRALCACEGKPSSYVELSISCRDLSNKDLFHRSDAFVKLFTSRDEQAWTTTPHISETVYNTLHPDFVRCFDVPVPATPSSISQEGPTDLRLSFDVYDRESSSPVLDKHDFIGRAQVHLSALLAHPFQTAEVPLVNALSAVPYKRTGLGGIVNGAVHATGFLPQTGTLTIRAEIVQIPTFSHNYHLTVRMPPMRVYRAPRAGSGLHAEIAADIAKRLRFPRGVFLVLSRMCRHGRAIWTPVFRSAVVSAQGGEVKFNISSEKADGGDDMRAMRFELFEFKRGGQHHTLGCFPVRFAALKYGCEQEAESEFIGEPCYDGVLMAGTLKRLKQPSLKEYSSWFDLALQDMAWILPGTRDPPLRVPAAPDPRPVLPCAR